MVLDHLIVQKMDDEDSAGATMQSILTYGAKALFDENQDDKDITCAYLPIHLSWNMYDKYVADTDNDIDNLIEKTEKEGDQEEGTQEQGFSFSFAKIWAAGKDTLEDVEADTPDDQGDSWAQALQRIAAVQEQRKVQEITGRGVRRRAAAAAPQVSRLAFAPPQHILIAMHSNSNNLTLTTVPLRQRHEQS
jgi:chromodomain-helicase-DNA-binding protein 4